MAKTVKYVAFGIASAKQFWVEIVTPAYEKFKAEPNAANALIAAILAWQVHDWIWHDQHPNEDTHENKAIYNAFKQRLVCDCPELAWIRDVAEAAKHRGLGRPDVEIRSMESQAHFIYYPGRAGRPMGSTMWRKPFTIELDDGTEHNFAEVLSHVIDNWQNKYFA